ncbi:putative Csh5-chitin synthase 5 [Endogone sp. FLAS-F59071]|nr:putative Csh5-chitin synthase 5 [Endogone sp. FLAS-F59071]|eukprot:RUS15398.1 putative Csh5-chitin synthase 5 [Endogone sp. FLAS-F59071]
MSNDSRSHRPRPNTTQTQTTLLRAPSSESLAPAASSAQSYQQNSQLRPRRQKSLVRPERERIDPNHPQYYYRQRAENLAPEQVALSTTGNKPIAPNGRQLSEGAPVQRYTAAPDMRRGKSVLGRDEPREARQRPSAGRVMSATMSVGGGGGQRKPPPSPVKKRENGPSLWIVFCYVVTMCCPAPVLSGCFGMATFPAQRAFREKMGLVAIILLICGAVGFLTFGFTQAVCPPPPLHFRTGTIDDGYLIINGYAYLLADWTGHPPIPGLTNTTTNILYPPINAGGLDASFLFQKVNQHCLNIITPKPGVSINQNGNQVPTYFPCKLFNPNHTIAPDPNTYMNYTECHLSQTARDAYYKLETKGILNNKGKYDKGAQVYYDWDDVNSKSDLVVYNGDVLNLALLASLPQNYFNVPNNGLIQGILNGSTLASLSGTDISYHVIRMNHKAEADCLSDIIKVGTLDTESIGCIASNIVLYVSFAVILGVIIIKFLLAVIFGWFLSWRLGNFNEGVSYKEKMKRANEIENWTEQIHQPADAIRPYSHAHKRKSLLPQTSRFTQPEPGRTNFNPVERPQSMFSRPGQSPKLSPTNSRTFGSYTPPPMGPHNTTPPASPSFGGLGGHDSNNETNSRRSSSSSFNSSSITTLQSTCPFPLARGVVPQPPPDYKPFNFPLMPTICLVTCYSEGEESMRTTLDSIATTDYPNSHKLIFVIADGIITGAGNRKSTPDICVSMMKDLVIPEEDVPPYSYVAIADGKKRLNMAKVYAGFYKYDDNTVDRRKQQRVPMICVAKCGSSEEAREKKPGNRGKRDSQIILMSFLQRVMFDERMTTLEYEIFNNIWRITGVSPDKFEIVLMVDADTKIYPDSLSRLVSCMARDPDIAGLCGETKIGNKTDSWVTMIQVFEYYISHHQSKAFESIFGGVTCLPGCFCMYRIKAPKGPNGYWVPILANPDIVEHYSENVVDTLHKKNLLLLGEDRYLSTLMLRTFPKRKMLFVPQAVCKTVVPDTFRVLLSQRRRWINSTIHNLMELVLVRDLCGTFCFSMQFVIFMELIGTVALPAAISFTLYLVALAIIGQPATLPLILLAVILGLPAVLIVMTSRKFVYVGWMLVYLISLVIWNFVLPIYAYWHFDDFTWGETRKVAGPGKDTAHGDKEGTFDPSKIVMKRWGEYEKDRRTRSAIARGFTPPKFVENPLLYRASRYEMDYVNKEIGTLNSSGSRYSNRLSVADSESEIPLNEKSYLPTGTYGSSVPRSSVEYLSNVGYALQDYSVQQQADTVPSLELPPNVSADGMEADMYDEQGDLSMMAAGSRYQPRRNSRTRYSEPPRTRYKKQPGTRYNEPPGIRYNEPGTRYSEPPATRYSEPPDTRYNDPPDNLGADDIPLPVINRESSFPPIEPIRYRQGSIASSLTSSPSLSPHPQPSQSPPLRGYNASYSPTVPPIAQAAPTPPPHRTPVQSQAAARGGVYSFDWANPAPHHNAVARLSYPPSSLAYAAPYPNVTTSSSPVTSAKRLSHPPAYLPANSSPLAQQQQISSRMTPPTTEPESSSPTGTNTGEPKSFYREPTRQQRKKV